MTLEMETRHRRARRPQVGIVETIIEGIVIEEESTPSLKQFLNGADKDYRIRYGTTLDKDQALGELARLRAIAQIASEEINQRQIPDEDECMVCKKVIPHGMKVTQMVNVKDYATGTVNTKVLCSIGCVREYNRTRVGLAELVK